MNGRALPLILAQDAERGAPGVQSDPGRVDAAHCAQAGRGGHFYSIRGELAEELTRTKGLTLKPIVSKGTFWLYFADQWDARSPAGLTFTAQALQGA
jgi:hypothetical protein